MRRPVFPRPSALLVVAALSAACGGVADLADEPLGILVDEVENRDDPAADRREVIGTFGHAGCAVLGPGTTVTLNDEDGVVLERGGSADDGTPNCLQPIVKAAFTVAPDLPPVDGRLVVADASGRVEVVLKDLVTARGFTLDLPDVASGSLSLDWAPAGQAPRTALARLEQGATSIALGPYGQPGEPLPLQPMVLDLQGVPAGDYTLVVDSTWAAEATMCEGVKSCDVATQHQERASITIE